MRGKFYATDDFDLAGHRILDWKWLDDIPTASASAGQVLTYDGVHVVWAAGGAGPGAVEWNDVLNKPATFPPSAHNHVVADISDFPSTFAPSAHTHPLSNLQQSGATAGQVVTWNGTSAEWQPKTPTGGGGGGAVDSIVAGSFISVNTSIGDVTITNTMTWSTLPDKPASFTPSTHTHSLSDLSQSGATSGQVPTWNSTATEWQAQVVVPALPPVALIGGWVPLKPGSGLYIGNRVDNNAGTAAMPVGTQNIGPFMSPYTFNVDQFVFTVSTAGSGVARIVVFESDADGRPSTKVFESGDLATNTTGHKTFTVPSGSFTIQAGKLYWMGVWAGVGVTVRASGPASGPTLSFALGAGTTVTLQRSLTRTQAFTGTSPDWAYGAAQHTALGHAQIMMRTT